MDDGTIITQSRHLGVNMTMQLKSAYGVIFDLFTRAGLALEHSKTELFHFSARPAMRCSKCRPGVCALHWQYAPDAQALFGGTWVSTLIDSSSSMSMSGIILPRPSRPSWRWGCWVTLHVVSRRRSGGLSIGLVCCLLQHTGTAYGIIMAHRARAS